MMWDVPCQSTTDPQFTHNLFNRFLFLTVDKLCIKIVLQCRNGLLKAISGMCAQGFLPTMKFQLSQLP